MKYLRRLSHAAGCEITNALGLLPAGTPISSSELLDGSSVRVRVHHHGNECDGKSILDLTTLAAECGTSLSLEACGPDAVAAVEALAAVVAARFYENENGDLTGPQSCMQPPP